MRDGVGEGCVDGFDGMILRSEMRIRNEAVVEVVRALTGCVAMA